MINQLLSLTELGIRSLIRVMLRETILRLIYSNSTDERQKKKKCKCCTFLFKSFYIKLQCMLKNFFISRKMKEFTFVFTILASGKHFSLGAVRRQYYNTKTITELLLKFREGVRNCDQSDCLLKQRIFLSKNSLDFWSFATGQHLNHFYQWETI